MHFIRRGFLLGICLGLTVAASAKSEEKLQAEISAAIIKLADQAADNFPRIEAGEVAYKDADKIVSLAPKQSALHANLYFVTELTDSKRHSLGAQYQGADAVNRATAAVRALPALGGAAWTLGGGPTPDAGKWQIEVRRDGRVIAKLVVNPADNTAILAIGIFPESVTDPAEVTRQLDELIIEGKRDFEGTPRAADPGLYGKKSVPRVLMSDESMLYVGPQFFSDYKAKWYDATPGSELVRDTLYAHLDELVANGQARKTLDETDANGARKLSVVVGDVSVELHADRSDNRLGTQLEVQRVGVRPDYVDPQRYSASRPRADESRSFTSSSSGSATHTTYEHTCVRCDGHGYIDTADAYGHYHHVTCPFCGGTGKVSN